MGNIGLHDLNGNIASPPFRGDAYGWDTFLQVTGGFSGTLKGTAGKIYYVDEENGDDDNDGLSPGTAFATLYKCFGNTTGNKNARDNYDDDAEYHVFVFPGSYDEAGDLRMYGHGMHLIGLGHPGSDSGVNITDTNCTYCPILFGAANSTIANIQFTMTSATNSTYGAIYLIAADNCVIQNCVFKNASGTGTNGILMDDVRGTKIVGNRFGDAGTSFTTSLNAEGGANYYLIDSLIRDNYIASSNTGAKGIYISGTSTSYSCVIDRNFVNLTGAGSTSKGIDQDATGCNLITDNYVMVDASATTIESAASNTGIIGNHTMAGTAAPVDPNEAIS